MKYTDDNLEWHDENELIRKLDAVEAVLNMADSLEEVVDILMTVPSIDITRCKDCVRWNDGICTMFDWYTADNSFCSQGERSDK